MAAGLAAQAVANVVFTPVDVVKERMQTQRLALEAGAAGAREFRHAGEALAAVVRSEGLFRGLFKGYGATLAVWGPWNMLYFAMYEAAKDACAAHMGLARPRGGEAEELPAWACAGAAAAAASGACVLTQPLDTAKVRALRLACATGLRRMQPRRAYSERHERHALRLPGLTRALCHACTHADASAGRARQ